AVAAGWRGAGSGEPGEVRAVDSEEPGRVRALNGDLLAVRRSAALGAFPEDASPGEDFDLEFSRALDGEKMVPEGPLPVRRLTSGSRNDAALRG
ncbi:MAG: hypothetical protein HOY71_32705, partial [Nonomuraea sp.]|nr:hypothetical protein [Nonomuraea sp.]